MTHEVEMDAKLKELYAAVGRGETVQYSASLMAPADWFFGCGYELGQRTYKNGLVMIWKVKPPTIRIGDVEIVAPVTEPLNYGDIYYVPALITRSDAPAAYPGYIWKDDSDDFKWLAQRLIFRASEDAIKASEALIALLVSLTSGIKTATQEQK